MTRRSSSGSPRSGWSDSSWPTTDGPARSLYLSIALGLLLGGALGNLIDRLRLGYVVDFVDVGIGDLRFYTFNVADAAISTAIVLLLAVAIVPSLARIVDARFDG